jgi:hypothetical protein
MDIKIQYIAFCAYSAEHTDIDITNNVDYRTPHSKIGVDIPL